MDDATLVERYNYPRFELEEFGPWLDFDQGPKVGERVDNFPLWALDDRGETDLTTLLKQNTYTVVEFGSFT